MIKLLKRECDLIDISGFENKVLLLIFDFFLILIPCILEYDHKGSPGLWFVYVIYTISMQVAVTRARMHDAKVVMSSKWHTETTLKRIITASIKTEMLGIVCMELFTLLALKTKENEQEIIRNLSQSIPMLMIFSIILSIITAFMFINVMSGLVVLCTSSAGYGAGLMSNFTPKDWNVYMVMVAFFGIALASFLLQAIITRLLFTTRIARKIRDKQNDWYGR